jgi:uncharacterized protein (TIGR02147 family)
MPDIFTYSDSRLFLKDYYDERKKAQSSFSYQYFADKAGLKSKTFIYRVIRGQKTLSKSAVFAVAQAVGLSKRETEYFETMVNFTQAKSDPEREFYFNHLQSFGRSHVAGRLRQDQFDYFAKWYLPALREIVAYLDFKEDYRLLARTLDPPITLAQARDGVKVLRDLGLIKRLPSGRYCLNDSSITTADTVRSLAVKTFQKENLRLAAEALERHERSRRDISTMTVGVTGEGFKRICEEVAAFRRRVAELAEAGGKVDRVYQVNVQVFPLTTTPKGECAC